MDEQLSVDIFDAIAPVEIRRMSCTSLSISTAVASHFSPPGLAAYYSTTATAAISACQQLQWTPTGVEWSSESYQSM